MTLLCSVYIIAYIYIIEADAPLFSHQLACFELYGINLKRNITLYGPLCGTIFQIYHHK